MQLLQVLLASVELTYFFLRLILYYSLFFNSSKYFCSSSISNNGFVIKLDDDLEFETTSSLKLQYFSENTNTIYRPYLEFKWDDSSFNTGSNSILDTDKATISLICTSHFSDFSRIAGRRTNEGSQQRLFPSDRGFEFAGQTIQDIKWGRS